ncbi:DUF3800 domain-containing protein [Cryobacterium sp. RTS3]|uniref:DUF3800 domain-containing protein n=1 Tax=Cryobacterium sp. RTS3 TaxID=3048643 RepID=UPI002B229A53|nr:DUF3800 domain-containing protein [Cryobacterium sp. RTS3]MEB0000845.1 DUF3800 domain-containing protein [Cryobacterium sp. RTS3]
MLLAYIDEIGETGAFVSKTDTRYKTSPAFGYAGFVIPAENARKFGSIFVQEKRLLFATDLKGVENPGRWERKGADIFRPLTHQNYPQQLRVFNGLVRRATELGASLFYYANEKPLGTPRQTTLDAEARETAAMRETLNRLCSHADYHERNLMVLIDQINESQRAKRLPNMYGHILSRAADRQEMRRIIEPPMHVDSTLSANIQFADWIAAALTRAIEFQLIENSPYDWIPACLAPLRNSFTYESKLHLNQRAIVDLNKGDVLHTKRAVFPPIAGQRLSNSVDPAILRRIYGAAQEAPSHGVRQRNGH